MCIIVIAATFEILALLLLAPLIEALLKSQEYIQLTDNLFFDIIRGFLPLDSAIRVQMAFMIFAISLAIKSLAHVILNYLLVQSKI